MDVVELLISRGANTNIRDNDGNTPISLAKDRGYKEIAVFLHKHRAKE
jgi:ankyrin repeat protein